MSRLTLDDRMKIFVLLSAWLLGCSQDVATGRRCKLGDDACVSSPRASGGAAGRSLDGTGAAGTSSTAAAGNTAIGNSDNALSVHVQDIQQMKIEIITLACAGDCADIEAVASGGNPPYAFVWEDGSTSAKRHVCLDASTQLGVSVTDSAITDDEFAYDAQTARTSVNANVLDCSDGGVQPRDAICIENPAFEGTPAPNVGVFDIPSWTDCFPPIGADVLDASLAAQAGYAAPAAGKTSVYMTAVGNTGESIGTTLCAPLQAGASYHFLVELWSGQNGTTSGFGHIEIFGGDAMCGEDESLWVSPMLSDAWQTYCVTLTPAQAHSTIAIEPRGPAADSLALGIGIDQIVPVASCKD